MPYPDDYRASTAPDRWVSAEEQQREEAECVADQISDAVDALYEAACELRRHAQDSWTPPTAYASASHAALLERANSLARDLRGLLDGRMPGERA